LGSEYVLPTKINLIELKNKYKLIRFAKRILERKRDFLREAVKSAILSLIDVILFLREELLEFLEFSYATYIKYKEVMNAYALLSTEKIKVLIKPVAKGGVSVPEFEIVEGRADKKAYPEGVRAIIEKFRESLPDMLKLVEILVELEILLREIEVANRIVNTLEKVVIPTLEEKISYINVMLSEMMISELSSLRVVISQVEGEKE